MVVKYHNDIIVFGLHRILVELPGVGWPEILLTGRFTCRTLYATLEARVLALFSYLQAVSSLL